MYNITFDYTSNYKKLFGTVDSRHPMILPLTHSPEVPATEPSGHTQPTVRMGKLSVTTQVWALLQGFLTIHGF